MAYENILRFTSGIPYIRGGEYEYTTVARLLSNYMARQTMDGEPVDGTLVTVSSDGRGVRVGFYPASSTPPYPVADIRALYNHVVDRLI